MHQILFFIGDFPVRSYGLILSLSILSAIGTAYFLTYKKDLWQKHILDFGICCGFAGLIGARLWDVFFFDWHYYSQHLSEIFFVWQGGMAIQGGVIGGAIAGYIYTKIHKIDTWAFADTITPAIILGQSMGRAANLLNGDAFGSPTGSNFGILYPTSTLAHHVYGNQPLWPTEIWEGQLDLLIFVILLVFSTTKPIKGHIFLLYIILYSTARFFLEYLRGDYQTIIWGLKSAQITSLTLILVSLSIFIFLSLKNKRAR